MLLEKSRSKVEIGMVHFIYFVTYIYISLLGPYHMHMDYIRFILRNRTRKQRYKTIPCGYESISIRTNVLVASINKIYISDLPAAMESKTYLLEQDKRSGLLMCVIC